MNPPQSNSTTFQPTPPPPPPPPPMPGDHVTEANIDLICEPMRPHMKMRTLSWRKIPKRRVLLNCHNKNQEPTKLEHLVDHNDNSRKIVEQLRSRFEANINDKGNTNLSSDDDTNIWYLIAKENKRIRQLDLTDRDTNPSSIIANCSTNSPTTKSATTTTSNTKSASKIREMLESVRRRMAAVTASQQSPTSSAITPSITSFNDPSKETSHLSKPTTPSFAFSDTLGHLSSQRKIAEPKDAVEAIDFDELESLFCLSTQPSDRSPNCLVSRRASWRTNVSSDSLLSSSNSFDLDNDYEDDFNDKNEYDDPNSLEWANVDILDSKKSLNINIFLKQVKRIDELIQQINQEEHEKVGQEKLEHLLKLLPDQKEQEQLMKFHERRRQNRLPVAERFLLQLITRVSNLELKIKFMILKEQFNCNMLALTPELDKLDKAVGEIRHSRQFRELLNLILVMGNFLNSGGYAADAAGFTLDSLNRLNEIRSNKIGITLIHYVAEVAVKMKLIEFQANELPTIQAASRVCIESIRLELESMFDKIQELKSDTDKEVKQVENSTDTVTFTDNVSANSLQIKSTPDRHFLLNHLRTLDDIWVKVDALRKRLTVDLELTRSRLADYLCEDPKIFKLNDCFRIISSFSQRLKVASEENERRQKLELSKFNCQLRRSNTIHSKLPRASTSSINSLTSSSTAGNSGPVNELNRLLTGSRQSLNSFGTRRSIGGIMGRQSMGSIGTTRLSIGSIGGVQQTNSSSTSRSSSSACFSNVSHA